MSDSKFNAVHELGAQDEPVKGSSDRSFGFVFTIFFAAIGFWPLMGGDDARVWPLSIAGMFLAASLVCPGVLGPLNRLWMKFGLLLHKITNPIIMGLVFFLAVTPTALIMRILGKDPLRRKIDREARSYWIDRTPPGPEPETMKNQF